jgi:hypothetical protein
MSTETLKDELARALTGGQQTSFARVTTAKVKAVSGGTASAIIGGDASATTAVTLCACSAVAGDTLAVVGQAGRWYAMGKAGEVRPAFTATLDSDESAAWSEVVKPAIDGASVDATALDVAVASLEADVSDAAESASQPETGGGEG